ncbi:uncharacterized protein B0I36DRAFT_331951 [Microdochium trichocladiopsis]|uniref:NmrA-like domain-containing protein n=1 Tax=Microdochium trichocladiopsis TaxID=1682393 RepID=A0A9P8XWV4_9PEZI|nr:uncharacterized protein B0I36DRAFT_331951 [Microdochium trichocladiopsis]KAH7024719.1 hypothetical protein B0I36DRAFT_331951 [Microdochium trichocladiopsis]
MDVRKILVVGATGAQGSATVAALAALLPSHPHLQILALTRSATAPKAQALKERYPSVTIVQGDLTDPAAFLDSHSDIDSIFLVTVPPNDEAHGVVFIDAAVARNIRHIVFSSVDRGGEDKSWTNPSTVAHFAAKHRVELHLRAVTAKDPATTRWTILRPAGFMDNYRPSSFGSMMAGLWATMPADRKMQLVSVEDIGKVAAAILVNPEPWVGRAVGLAGDDLTFQEADGAYKRVYGHEMPRTWGLLSRGVRWAVADARQSMDWFEKEGFSVDMELLGRDGFGLQDFETWLRSDKERPLVEEVPRTEGNK